MQKNLKAKWLKMLRSGNYRQSKGQLVTRGKRTSYCCLGVLCRADGATFDFGGFPNFPDGVRGSSRTLFNRDLLNRFGLPDSTTNALMNMNDEQNRNFKQIADWIEKNI